MSSFSNKARLGFALGVAWIFCTVAATSFAGEITGNGKSLKNEDGTLNGKSECAFSGREDDPESGDFKGPIAQSWGQLPKIVRDFLTTIGRHPGDACNPHKSGD